MSGAIAIFVKTVGLSPLKTRLAKTIGTDNAEAFHLAASSAVSSIVQQTYLDCYYAVAEQSAVNHPDWQDLTCIWQGEGGLGERMRLVHQSLLKKHDFVLLVGADIPQMTVDEIFKASVYLEDASQKRSAFAPSEDGGFWLFGSNFVIAENIWTDVLYSQANTGDSFLQAIKALAPVKILDTCRDVDELADLHALQVSLAGLAQPTEEQQQLSKFLTNIF
ncbi:MAG: DUF2064 domain-containing protein [Methyloprofundus sp.]|nr:DUF2064 domain-containing protein [Methyloprofundus sp.]